MSIHYGGVLSGAKRGRTSDDGFVTITHTELQKFADESNRHRNVVVALSDGENDAPALRLTLSRLSYEVGNATSVRAHTSGKEELRVVIDDAHVATVTSPSGATARYHSVRSEWKDEAKENTTTMQDSYILQDEWEEGFMQLKKLS